MVLDKTDKIELNSATARASNTLAENTQENGLRVLVDWVTCSFTIATNLQNLLTLLGLEKDIEKVEVKEGSRYEFAGYDLTYKIGLIEIFHGSQEDENSEDGYSPEVSSKWMLNMSGQACRQYEHSTTRGFDFLFAILENLSVKYTRLDIAIDDFKKIYNVNTFRNAVFNKQCITHLKEWGNHTRGLINEGSESLTMDNFYLGSLKSRFSINVYDKKLERLSKNEECLYDSWTRTEVRFKNDYAQQFVDHILLDSRSIGYQVRAFLSEKVNFLNRTVAISTKNRARDIKDKKNNARWWLKFLGEVGKLHLSVAIPDKTLKETQEWIVKQVSPSLAMLSIYQPELYGDFIKSVTSIGLAKMKKAHDVKVATQLHLDSLNKNNTNIKITK